MSDLTALTIADARAGLDARDFSARDPEGHLWNFGTYRPAIEE